MIDKKYRKMKYICHKKPEYPTMKKSITALLLLLPLLFTACKEDPEAPARPWLAAAQEAFASGECDRAKSCIDSIRILCPRAIETRRTALELLREVEKSEALRTIAYTDSVLALTQTTLERLTPTFVFERDAAYQDLGLFSMASQDLLRNRGRNFLRAVTDEKGRMTLTSLYNGSSYIHHRAVRVSAGGTFAETPVSTDPYESSNAVQKTERCDFVLGADGGVIDFIALHAGESVKVEYLGEKTYATNLTRDDTRAIASVLELARTLQTREQMLSIGDEAHRKLQFFEHQQQKSQPTE